MRGVFNSCVDILSFEKGIISQNLVEGRAVGEELKNVADANALIANAGTASALACLNGNSFKSADPHIQPVVYS